MAVTLATVAARAGVSPATVSRVLNKNYPVATETRRRVERAVRELDYVVNAHARALLHARSGIIGLVLNEISDPFFGTIAGGVHAAAGSLHRLVVTCSSAGIPEQEFAYIEMLRRQRADAVILVGSAPVDLVYRKQIAAHARGLRSQRAPLVLLGRPLPTRHTLALTLALDHHDGARDATRHLLELGHTAIAHITGTPGRTIALEREDGFRDAMRAAGATVSPKLVVAGHFTRESGRAGARTLLDSGVPFTAVFAANDLMAAGALATFREAGVRVPDDVSVVGLDDIPPSVDLGLTTVRLPLTEAGRQAVSLALSGEAPVRPVILGHELVVRSSSAPPAKRNRRKRLSA